MLKSVPIFINTGIIDKYYQQHAKNPPKSTKTGEKGKFSPCIDIF